MGELLDAYHAGRKAASDNLVIGEVFIGASAAADADGYTKRGPRMLFIEGYLERQRELFPDGVNTTGDGRIISE